MPNLVEIGATALKCGNNFGMIVEYLHGEVLDISKTVLLFFSLAVPEKF
jgi:hypothetical protein